MSEALIGLAQGLTRYHRLLKQQRWKRSTSAFCEDIIITVDEHDLDSQVDVEGSIVNGRRFPTRKDRPDVHWYLDLIDSSEEDIIIDKSRQNYVSHAQRAAELKHVLSFPNFRIALIFEDEEAARAHIEQRTMAMFEMTPPWYREQFTLEVKKGHFVVSKRNGRPWNSRIVPISKSEDPLRGETYSWVVWEEMARQSWAKQAFKAVRPTIQGKKDPKTGKVLKGRFFAISTPQPMAFHGELLGDEDVRDHAIAVARGEVQVA